MVQHRGASCELVEELVENLGLGPWPLASVLQAGWSLGRIRAAVQAGRLVRPRRGVLALPFDELTPFGLASEASIRAALLVCDSEAVVSHESAGVMHRTWVPWPASPMVHVTTSGKPDRRHGGVRCHESRLPAHDITLVDGLRVTSLARTGIDLARGRSLPEALVALDGVSRTYLQLQEGVDLVSLRDPEVRTELRRQVLDPLSEAFGSVWSWPGSVVIRDALHLLDPASESPFESRSRGWMAVAHLPRPEIAFSVHGASGRRYFADFAWPAHMVLGEADGVGKFGQMPDEIARRLRDERVRQRDLEDAGWRFARWDSSESAPSVISRLRKALFA